MHPTFAKVLTYTLCFGIILPSRKQISSYGTEVAIPVSKLSTTAADKLLQVLLAFELVAEWRLGAMATHLGFSKSTVHRLLGQLKGYDLVEQDSSSGNYRLGLRACRLTLSARPYKVLQRTARPYLEALASTSQETSFLTVAEGIHSLCIDRVEGTQGLRFSMTIGAQVPLHLGASNLILLAYLEPEKRDAVARRWIPDTLERERFLANLELIKQQGYVYTVAQFTPDVAAIAVPVMDEENHTLMAGLSVGGPSTRFTEEVALQLLSDLYIASSELTDVFQLNLGTRMEVYV